MPGRLRQSDEFGHDLGSDLDHDELLHFNFFDPSVRVGAFFRLSTRVGQATACCFLSDGRVAFFSGSSSALRSGDFEAAGLKVEVLRPLEELALTFNGSISLLDDPTALSGGSDLSLAETQSSAEVELTFIGLSPAHGAQDSLEPNDEAGDQGGYEQLVRAVGHIRVGDEACLVDGFGARSHTWGYDPPDLSRHRLTCNVGPTFGFSVSRCESCEGVITTNGFAWDGSMILPLRHLELLSPGAGGEPLGVTLLAGDREWALAGRLVTSVPLDLADRSHQEGPMRWTLEDGRVGHGFSERLESDLNPLSS